jgi:hypothetical protein
MRRCSRVPDEVPGTYHVYDGQKLLGVLKLDGSEYYIAIDVDGAHHGRYRLLSDAVAALPERVS